jgi:hypothetical protein
MMPDEFVDAEVERASRRMRVCRAGPRSGPRRRRDRPGSMRQGGSVRIPRRSKPDPASAIQLSSAARSPGAVRTPLGDRSTNDTMAGIFRKPVDTSDDRTGVRLDEDQRKLPKDTPTRTREDCDGRDLSRCHLQHHAPRPACHVDGLTRVPSSALASEIPHQPHRVAGTCGHGHGHGRARARSRPGKNAEGVFPRPASRSNGGRWCV